jgi:hypothetical protein
VPPDIVAVEWVKQAVMVSEVAERPKSARDTLWEGVTRILSYAACVNEKVIHRRRTSYPF